MLDEDAQLVEVLPAKEYDASHIRGAVNIPLRKLAAETARQLDPTRPVITYCFDFQCDLSSRAAWRLETLGFKQVYRYVAGKMDWLANGLPGEGRDAAQPQIVAICRKDVATCALRDPLDDVKGRIAATPYDACAVIDERRIVLGLVRSDKLETRGPTQVEDIMEAGPRTYRPNVPVEELLAQMIERRFDLALVTTSDGELIGLVRLADLAGANGAKAT
jgi:rhodanese-related sulfurtransferase/CBS domain-containing protein